MKPSHNRETADARAPAPDAADPSAVDAALEGTNPGAEPQTDATGEVNVESLRKKAAERDEFLKLLQHVRADFANYQKRVQKEIDSARRFAVQPLVLDLLPGLDNLERAIQAAEPAGSAGGLLDGIRLVHQNLLAALARHGVQPIEAAGASFNPDRHEALMEQPAPDKPPRTVLQELEKGYALHDRVIRPAKVIVSTATPREMAAETPIDD